MKKVTVLAAIAGMAIALAAAYYSPWFNDDPGVSKHGLKQGTGKKSGLKAGQPKPYKGDLPSVAGVNIRNAVLEKVYSGLAYPWAMEFLSDRKLLISEFGGRLVILDLDTRSITPVSGLPDYVATGQGQIGLLDIVLHPDFAANGIIYFSHAIESTSEPGKYTTAVTRAELTNDQLAATRRIFVATPYGGSNSNFGGALAFDASGMLYIGTGDRSMDVRAQKPDHLNGKIIRLTDAGEVPADNPFVADPGTADSVFALGVRNPQGLVFDPESGSLFETEHGPMGGDEVNRIEAGKNYGWPTITYGANYNTQKKGLGTALEGLEQPLFYFLPSIAVSPLEIYRGTMFPEWQGDLLVGALKGAHVNKLDLVDGRVISEQRILDELKGRVRDIKVAADGSIYVLVQNGGKVYRLYRDFSRKDLEQPAQRKGSAVYATICASCHSAGLAGIPQLGDAEAWTERALKGKEQLFQNTLYGIGGMPPAGLCDNCSEAELRAAINFMLKGTRKPKPQASAPAEPPNFVILIADDLGWSDIGPYGNQVAYTPNIDRLAAAGIRFDNAFLTTSSCSASRGSILTGRYPHSNGLMHLHQPLPASETTIARLLGDAGYYTAAVGKWHLGNAARSQFSTVIEDRSGSGTVHWIDALRDRPDDRPFFFWLASRDPHRPHPAITDPGRHTYDPDAIRAPDGLVDGPGTRGEVADYLGEVSRFDRDVGRVMAELRAQGVEENTVVIVMSDNGRPFPFAKQLLYDDGIKTPFIVHWPESIRSAGNRGQLISMVDLAPTLLAWAGLPIPTAMQGVSFAGMIGDADRRTRDYIYAERNWHGGNAHERLVRSLDWAYKENQFPLHGDCVGNPYSFTRTFRELAAAHRAGLLSDSSAACFATVRDRAELLAVDASGLAGMDNHINEPRLRAVANKMSTALAHWRQQTGDLNYAPYVPSPGTPTEG
jgi:glucose/arabinose dehydrogenase/arylsulfatase A-like enzyme/cytochrome c5